MPMEALCGLFGSNIIFSNWTFGEYIKCVCVPRVVDRGRVKLNLFQLIVIGSGLTSNAEDIKMEYMPQCHIDIVYSIELNFE